MPATRYAVPKPTMPFPVTAEMIACMAAVGTMRFRAARATTACTAKTATT